MGFINNFCLFLENKSYMLTDSKRLECRRKKAHELKMMRHDAQLTIKELSLLSRISCFTISCMENAKRSWSVDTEFMYVHAIKEITQKTV